MSNPESGADPSYAIAIDETDTHPTSSPDTDLDMLDSDSDEDGGMQLDDAPPATLFQNLMRREGHLADSDTHTLTQMRGDGEFEAPSSIVNILLVLLIYILVSPCCLLRPQTHYLPIPVQLQSHQLTRLESDFTIHPPNPFSSTPNPHNTPSHSALRHYQVLNQEEGKDLNQETVPPPVRRTRLREEQHAAMSVLNDWELLVAYALNNRRVSLSRKPASTSLVCSSCKKAYIDLTGHLCGT